MAHLSSYRLRWIQAAETCEERAVDTDGSVLQIEYPQGDDTIDVQTAEHLRKKATVLRLAAKILRGEVVDVQCVDLEKVR